MKTFFVSALAVIVIGVVAAGLVFGVGPLASWELRTARFAELLSGDERKQRAAEAEREAARLRDEKRRAAREIDELEEQRRERLTLLTATLGVTPVSSLTATEKRLFQEAARHRSLASARAEERPIVLLRDPVQIDERTVLKAGTPVEFIHYDRDTVATIRHDGARYQVGTHQITAPF